MPPGGPPAGAPAECVINISEGRDPAVIADVAAAGGDRLLDVHSDPEHHRSVLTLAGPLAAVESAARSVAAAAVRAIDLRTHEGVHPRLGAVDVVPFVPLPDPAGMPPDLGPALAARDRFARWLGDELGVPCFTYGPERTLPDVRRHAFAPWAPDTGPATPHPTAGACAVGARHVLIAYNVWLAVADPDEPAGPDVVAVARSLARELRGPGLRTLGLAVAGGAQVSCNVTEPDRVALVDVYDAVARGAAAVGCEARRGELVGLLPAAALDAVPGARRAEVGVSAGDTIEFRLAARPD